MKAYWCYIWWNIWCFIKHCHCQQPPRNLWLCKTKDAYIITFSWRIAPMLCEFHFAVFLYLLLFKLGWKNFTFQTTWCFKCFYQIFRTRYPMLFQIKFVRHVALSAASLSNLTETILALLLTCLNCVIVLVRQLTNFSSVLTFSLSMLFHLLVITIFFSITCIT